MASIEHFSHKFSWDGGGKEVFVCGSFNGWEKIPMAKSRSKLGVFTATVPLSEGRHDYNFLVDGEWMLDVNQERSTNDSGALNNVCWIPEVSTAVSSAMSQDSHASSEDIHFMTIDTEDPQEEDSESDTESTASSMDLSTRQPCVKLLVKCFQAPHILKENLSKQLQSYGLSDNVTRMQWNTSRNGKGYYTICVTPPQVGEDAILMLNGSLLLGKYKLSVQKQNRTRRRKRSSTKEERTSEKEKPLSKKKNTKVFVGSMPKFVTDNQLKDHFSSFKAKIVRVDIIKDKESGKSKGFGFITFSNRISAEAAIKKMAKTLLLNTYPIKVNLAKEDQSPVADSPIIGSPRQVAPEEDNSDTESVCSLSGEKCQLFVNSNPPLPDKITNKQISEHFSSYKGRFLSAKVIRDKQRKSKGYAIVTFTNAELADEAARVYNDSMLLGVFKLNIHCKQGEKAAPSLMKSSAGRRPSNSEESTPHIHVPATPSYNTKQQFTVKLTCLPPSLTNEQLVERLRIFGELPEPPKIFESKNRYALAQYSTLMAAQKAVHGLDKKVLDGYNIKVSLKGGESIKPSVPQAPTPSFALGSQWTVSLDHVDSLVSAEELKTMVGVSGVKVERLTSPPSRVLLYLPSNEDAHNVVKRLNGMSLLGKAIQANVITLGRTVNKEVKIPFDHQHNVPTPAANTPYLQEIIPPQFHSSMSFPPPSVTVPTSLQSSRITHPHPPGSESSLTLSPADWNRLMIAGPSGRMLYQDVIEPYKTNPGIHIREDMISRTIFFAGLPEAIASAYSRVTGEVYRELTIQDRHKKTSLVALRQDLPSILQQKYDVRLTGYDESSTFIGLVGDDRNLQFARQELESALGGIKTLEVNISLAQPLLRSAKERFCIENLQVCIFSHDTRPSVVLYSLSKSSTETASVVLKQGLFTENITNISSEVCDQLISTLNPPFVDIEQKESNVLVKSYLQQECASVCTALRERMETATSQKIPVQCSPEETAYLIYLHKTDHKAREQLSSLSAEFVVRKSTVFLKGNPQAIQTAQALIRGDFLSQVSTRRFVYQNRRFVSQIEDVVLKPVSDEVIWIIQEQKAPAHKQRSRSEGDETEISVIICSKHHEVFQTVCSCLKQVESSHKKLTLRKGAARSIRLNEIKSELEMSYRVRIINRDDFMMIHGLTKKEVCDCAAEILDRVNSRHEITKFIPLTTHQQLFIRHKQDFEELKEDCNELRIVRSKSESEMFSILIRGPIKSVEPVYEKLVGVRNGITTGKFEVNYESKYYHMWKKRWDQIKKDKERTCNIVIDISKEARQQSIPKDEVTTTTIYVVGEESEVFQIGEEISQTATITKTIPLTPIAANTLRKDKKEFLWPLAVYFYIKCQSTTFEAELTAPEDCSEELDTAEEEIQKFLGERTMTSKILTSNNEVVGLVLNSHFKYTTYLSHANSIARNCRIKVYPLKKPQSGLKLSGTPAAILVAEQPLITQVIQPIELSVGQEQLTVKPMFRSVFSTSSFLQFTYKLQEELCVLCTYPRSTRPNKVVRSSMIQPSSTARCLKLEICKGSVVSEQTDVIVNAANEGLQHIGGLAKAILEAGGQTIQTESDDYVRDHMKLKAGEVVALGPGKLPCKVIVHAVGPRWKGGKVGEESLLYITVYKSLVFASSAQYESISFPAISAGIFAVPTSLCAKASLKAVQDFCQTYPSSTLHTVRFVLFAQSELDDFCSYFDSGAILTSNISQPTTANPVTSAPSGAWFWTNDLGTYTPYTSEISQQLSTVHSVSPQGNCNLTLHGQMYCVDFPTMIQTNVQTGHRRVVKYDANSSPPSSRGTAHWFYRDDKSGFSPYNSSDNQSIEQMYRDGVPGVLKIGRTVYTFDFSSMCQINTTTNYKRPLQRREGPDQPNPPATPAPKICDPSSGQQEVCVTLRGPRDSLEAAKTKLKKKLDSYMQTEDINIRFALSHQFSSKLENVALKHQVGFSVTESQVGSKKQSLVTLEGINSDVQVVVKTVQQLIIDHQLDRADAEISIPPEWQDQNLTTEVFPVSPKTPEWTRVEQKFKATLSTSRIVSISRIQNTWLWEAYCAHKKRLHLKNNGNVNEKELFHGTRGNDPKLIYEGENGFDMRYSNQGMWGTANYFAVNANYSNNYSYTTSDGCKEIFFVKVLTGDSYRCVSNGSLRKPPQKPRGSAGGKVHFTNMDYDSVTGDTNGSQVFMTYDNDKAYPAYLIKYQ